MSAPGVFCWLLGILALNGAVTVTEALTCQSCTTTTPSSSCPSTCTAAKGGSCLSASVDNTLDGKPYTSFARGCISFNITQPVLSFSFGNGTYCMSNVTMCSGENCNKDIYPVGKNSTPNGLQCPSCFSQTENTCNGVMMPCTGLDTFCINASGTIRKQATVDISEFAAQGCSTANETNIQLPYTMRTEQNTYQIQKMNSSPAAAIPTTAPPAATTTPPAATTTPSTPSTARSGSGSKHTLKSFSLALLLLLVFLGLCW